MFLEEFVEFLTSVFNCILKVTRFILETFGQILAGICLLPVLLWPPFYPTLYKEIWQSNLSLRTIFSLSRATKVRN